MVIDQRNAGSSVTPTDTQYTLDRWRAIAGASSKFSVQRSTVAPTGFSNSLLMTSLSAYTPSSSEAFGVLQRIEGFNCADLMFGTANARTVTVSFWVRSSLTGTFSGFLNNQSFDRAYPFTYTISAANTWEQKSVTVAGDTSGTWGSGNDGCIGVGFSIGAGSNFTAASGAWTSGNRLAATGQTNFVGTNGATFYITGVQLEVGTQATSFEYRQYQQELALCQRYYQSGMKCYGVWAAITQARCQSMLPVTMRTAPAVTLLFNNSTLYYENWNNVGYNGNGTETVGSTFSVPNIIDFQFNIAGGRTVLLNSFAMISNGIVCSAEL
jgi:hypothetical protein